MTLYDLVQMYEFKEIEPYLFEYYSDLVKDEKNTYKEEYFKMFLVEHYKAKESFDELKRMAPGYDSREPIDLNEYYDFYECVDEPWDECLAREIVINPKFRYEEVLAAFLNDCKESSDYGGDYLTKPNKYELKAISIDNRRLFNYAKEYLRKKSEGHYLIDSNGRYWLQSDEMLSVYNRRRAHRNRSKRMRDSRQGCSYRRNLWQSVLKKLIDEIITVVPGQSESAFNYLYQARRKQYHFFFRSRTNNVFERGNYLADLLTNYYVFDMTGYTRAEVVICTSLLYPLSSSEELLIRETMRQILPDSIRYRVLIGIKDELMNLEKDIQILLILSV